MDLTPYIEPGSAAVVALLLVFVVRRLIGQMGDDIKELKATALTSGAELRELKAQGDDIKELLEEQARYMREDMADDHATALQRKPLRFVMATPPHGVPPIRAEDDRPRPNGPSRLENLG